MDKRQRDCFDGLKSIAVSAGWTMISIIYINVKTKIKLKCPNGHIVDRVPGEFKRIQSCPECEPKKHKSKAEYREEFFSLLNKDGYKLKSEYITGNQHVTVICASNHEYDIKPNEFRRNIRCVKCYHQPSEDVKEMFMSEIADSRYTLISPYVKSLEHVTLKCPEGHDYKVTPRRFMEGTRCTTCISGVKLKAKQKLYKVAEARGFQITGDYIDTHTLIDVICPKGHQIKIEPNAFKRGIDCAKCSGLCPTQYREELFDLIRSEGHILIGEYLESHTKIWLQCPNGHEREVDPRQFRMGSRCPNCPNTGSIGERNVKKVLESLSIKFKSEHRFKKFDKFHRVRYDFYFVYNEHEYVIEFDGGLHFEYVECKHHDVVNYYRARFYDVLKTYWVLSDNVRIIRIDHTQMKNIRHHIIEALKLDREWYFSDMKLYDYIINPTDNLITKCEFENGIIRRHRKSK